ncbi:MAG: hypothetical protein WAV90_02500 [Gordonia amarae]
MRQKTVFDLCSTHGSLGGGRRTAEIVCEGGPGYGGPCTPRPCRVLPGRDFYGEGHSDEEFAQMISDWAVNRGGAR